MDDNAPPGPFVAPEKRGDNYWVEFVEGRGWMEGRLGEGGELGRPCGGKPSPMVIATVTYGGGGVCI